MAAAISTIYGTDLYVGGNISSLSMTIPAGAVGDAAVAAGAGIQVSKLKLRFQENYRNGPSGQTAVTEAAFIHLVRGATATLLDFKASSINAIPIGAATVTLDLLKNGSTVLTSVITLSSANTLRQIVVASAFTSTSAVAGDVFEVNVTATAGGGTLPKGVVAQLNLNEDPA